MAKKNTQPTPEEQQQIQMGQQQEAAQLQQQMAEIDAINKKTASIQQEKENKTHDTEFTQFYGSGQANPNNLNVIGKEEVAEAMKTLLKYKDQKAYIETKIIENEEFWKMNHWDVVYKGDQKAADKRVKPKSAWLFNLIINKHADAMDNYPEANILPRARDDEEAAKALSQIIPVVLEQNHYEDTYSDCQWYKCKNGTSVQAVLWDNNKNNGLGDIEIKKLDILSVFWSANVADIQGSPNVFVVQMVPNDDIREMYPDIQPGGASMGFTTDENYHVGADTSDETAVIDWYYKKRVAIQDEYGIPKMQTLLHYCKFCNGQVIYASENDPQYAQRGWYDHGLYPLVFDTMFPVEGSAMGLGYIDVEKDDQIYIDKLQQAILESAITNARPRYFFRSDGQVNEDEFLDLSSPVVHVEGSIGADNVVPIANSNFNATYENIFLQKVQEMKDTSGNTASSQGQTSSVTSASGIASLQEAAGKLSRDANSTSYRAFREVVNLVIELIRQFYDEPRCFRIIGEDGQPDFVEFDNSAIKPQNQGMAMGIDLGSRLPVMDIDVKPQKRNAYSKESQNQTALNLYNMGFFAPTNADASLACLDMMDFDQIDKVKDKISENGTLMQMVMAMQQQLAVYQQAMVNAGMVDPEMMASQAQADNSAVSKQASSGNAGNKGGSVETSKGSLSTQAASAARGATAPR